MAQPRTPTPLPFDLLPRLWFAKHLELGPAHVDAYWVKPRFTLAQVDRSIQAGHPSIQELSTRAWASRYLY